MAAGTVDREGTSFKSAVTDAGGHRRVCCDQAFEVDNQELNIHD